MAIRTQQHALCRLRADLLERARDPAACESERLRGGVDVMKVKSHRVSVVSAELTATTSFSNEYLLDFATSPRDRLGPALLAPRVHVRADEGKLGLTVLTAPAR